MKILAIDGHPAEGGFAGAMLKRYGDAAAQGGADVTRIALRDVAFDPILHHGYHQRQDWEPDLRAVVEALVACDHFVIGFPMWWGSQPALVKGFFDRVLLPSVAFKYRENGQSWDRLLAGRSADAIITADTPRLFLDLMYGAPIVKQTRRQVFDFCGFKPVRIRYVAPIRKQKPEQFNTWLGQAARMGATIKPSSKPKTMPDLS
ncbi:MAG: NAD(P)H-dependent oxidoreductase [Pseudomonadota bacterium]